MKSIKISAISIIAILFVGSMTLFGCGDGDLGTQTTTPPPTLDESIKKIQSNEHMPPQAKEAAINAAKAQDAAGKAMAAEAKNHPPKK